MIATIEWDRSHTIWVRALKPNRSRPQAERTCQQCLYVIRPEPFVFAFGTYVAVAREQCYQDCYFHMAMHHALALPVLVLKQPFVAIDFTLPVDLLHPLRIDE